MTPSLYQAIATAIEEAADGLRLPSAFDPAAIESVAGGCINRGYRLPTEGGEESIFVKTNAAAKADMFSAEADALAALADTHSLRVPRPLAHGIDGDTAFLALEWLELTSHGDQGEMGRQLAVLHRRQSPDGRFGWHRDNVIGETLQANAWCVDWAEFFVGRRLRPQFELAAEHGRVFSGCEVLLDRVGDILADHRPSASLVHGDLWGGNAAFDAISGEPVVFDPASYFGDRETDLAFSEMFGGFGAEFYGAYESAYPLPPGYAQRREIYNLYHVLNHFNLFGGGYASQAAQMIERLLRL